MAATRYTLSVQNPCSETWEQMSPVEAGRFCDSCAKTIVDLTGLSDRQLMEWFSSRPERVCGRFLPSQLDRELRVIPNPSRIARLAKVAAGLALFALAAPENGIAAPAGITCGPKSQSTNYPSIKSTSHDTTTVKKISGRVIEKESGEALIGAVVTIREAGIKTSTDQNGMFAIHLPDSLLKKRFTVSVASIGYVSTTIDITPSMLQKVGTLEIRLKLDEVILGEVIVVARKHWWQFWRR